MKKMIIKTRRASAMIVTLLLMAILLTLTLGLSMLTVSEIRQTGDIVAGGKAYYAAEAGIENALLDLNEHLPGFQTKSIPDSKDGWIVVNSADPAKLGGEDLVYRYRIRNQGDKYPYFDSDTPYFLSPGVGITKDVLYSQHPEKTYDILPLNQTVTIPLFVDCGYPSGTFKDVTNFVLQYYVDFHTADMDNLVYKENLALKLQDFDILRWKLFGEPKVRDPWSDPLKPLQTHSISDFWPAHELNTAALPVCIGSDLKIAAEDCLLPTPKIELTTIPDEYIANWSNFSSSIEDIQNAWGFARQCYTRDAGQAVAGGAISPIDGTVTTGIKKGCSISEFMKNHRKNYLTITNVVNPDIIGITDPAKRNAKANIYYRVVARKDPLSTCPGQADTDSDVMVREYADISADGFSRGDSVKQSIDAKLKLNSFLPVFNFTLFRTDPSKTNPEDTIVNPLFNKAFNTGFMPL